MAIALSIQGVKALEPGLWKARLRPGELKLLGRTDSRLGPLSVLLIAAGVTFDQSASTLTFDPMAARLLNLGTTDDAVIVQSPATPATDTQDEPIGGPGGYAPGDSLFLNKLSGELRQLGTQLLQGVRAEYAGELRYYEKSGKYVETPDNFWTIRIQSRDRSLRVTVRGTPDTFDEPGALQIKPDMGGYSSFKVQSPAQVDDFLRVLRQVPKKGH